MLCNELLRNFLLGMLCFFIPLSCALCARRISLFLVVFLAVAGWLAAERHNQDERQRVFKLLLQPPFSPLQPDLHMHVQRDNAWRRMERVAELGMMDLMRVPWYVVRVCV